ncbi:RNA-guided endonuclease IscB [Alicyclobacillus fodiniaquatilis]|uniref:RNA-guided endonuclease IscB n=1 Tax=Alicyclobacillus fodiniaquatilis TaxID=1661150 RepID=A0ABW4JDG5_9BACL
MVFVLNQNKAPLPPCHPAQARKWISSGKATIHRQVPFTIRLKKRVESRNNGFYRIKLDPGAKTTGVAVTVETGNTAKVVFLGELQHKTDIKSKLDTRRALRRGRRNRKTRYRQSRFLNRKRKEGWLPPSLEARVNQTFQMVRKLTYIIPLQAISMELVRFDTQALQNPEISGVEYQQGELMGYEVREYLLEKFHRACVYCGVKNVPLEVEHIIPKSRGGSNRISNLALSCHECNQEKGNRTAEEYGHPEVQALAKKPLKDAAAVNSTRWRLFERLKEFGLPIECGTGARTKMQRIQHGLPKEHYYDALCVGESTQESFSKMPTVVHVWSAKGRGCRQMVNNDKYGFPRGKAKSAKQVFGFQTGDLVRAKVPKGKYAGMWNGRVAVRARGSFDIFQDGKRVAQGVSHRYCRVIQRADGWQYEQKKI